MKAKELTIDTPVYFKVDMDKILTTRPFAILQEANKVTITLYDYYKTDYTCSPDEMVAKSGCSSIYLDRDEALKRQAQMRQEHIDYCRKAVDNALKNYESAVDLYFQKPLSTPCSKEFYDKHCKKQDNE